MSDRFEELLARLLDDELSQVELSELTDLVRNDPSRQAELQSQLEAAEMLVLAEDELHTPERFLVGLRTADEAVPDGFGPVTEIQERKTSSFWWATPLAAAAVLVLAFLLWPSDAALRSIATIQSLHGEVQWTGDGGQLHEAQPGQRISGGTIETLSADAWAVVVYPDGSAITVLGQSELTVTEDVEGRKVLRLNDGVMSADVQPQPEGRPMIVRTPTAELEVVGTQFNLDAESSRTMLTVNEGLVRLKRQRFGFEFNTSGGAITHREHRGLDPGAITIADVLKQAGYATGMFGKWHLGTQPQFHPQARGFDELYGFLAGAHSFLPVKRPEQIFSTIMRGNEPVKEPRYLTDAIARETVNFIDHHTDTPFFAYVPFNAVHTPIEATKKYQDRFPNIENAKRRDYYAMTSALDDAVGAIVAALKKHQLNDRTLVIFLNDNGGPEYTGVQSNGPLRLGKLFLFEGGIRVPLLVKWPAVIEAGQVFDGVTSSLDVFPTLCNAAGVKLPEEFRLDGVDLLPRLTGVAEGPPHETLFWSSGPNKAVRHQNWKFIKSGDSTWLFDLSNDIGEERNLKDSDPEMLRKLEALLDKWQSEMSAPAWPSKPQRRKVSIDGQTWKINI